VQPEHTQDRVGEQPMILDDQDAGDDVRPSSASSVLAAIHCV
jgi:hypothetical protein